RGLDGEPRCGLEPAEAEVEPLVLERPRQIETLGVARLGEPRELGAARVRQAEQPRYLVERLADDPITAEPRDVDELRVAAGHEQREKRKRGRVVLEHAREQVSLEVMD